MPDNKRNLRPILTNDGSYSIYHPALDETYHSRFGAITESTHVFIRNGLERMAGDSVRILDVGLGTGLNAALSSEYALLNRQMINYLALEPFPLPDEMLAEIEKGIPANLRSHFQSISEAPWDKTVNPHLHFSFMKVRTEIQMFLFNRKFDLIYYDAFAPDKQPEMWTPEIFNALFQLLEPGGLLTTYCAKGMVKRILKEAGFRVENIPGPPGKREMTLAFKPV